MYKTQKLAHGLEKLSDKKHTSFDEAISFKW